MKKGKKLYEGKAKIIYATQDKDLVIQYFKDDATAFNNQKKSTIEGKGVLNNRISEHILSNLSQIGIKNHLVKRLNMREQVIKLVEIIPIEFVVRNVATGSLTKRLGIPDGTIIDISVGAPVLADINNLPMVTVGNPHSFYIGQPQIGCTIENVSGQLTPGGTGTFEIHVENTETLNFLLFEIIDMPNLMTVTNITPVGRFEAGGTIDGSTGETEDGIFYFLGFDYVESGENPLGIEPGTGPILEIEVEFNTNISNPSVVFMVDSIYAEDFTSNPLTIVADDFGQFSGDMVSLYPDGTMPSNFALRPNYPNPFNPSTIISYDIPLTSDVTIDVYDMRGRMIRNLVSKTQSAGHYFVVWHGSDHFGNNVGAGVYIYQLRAGNKTLSQKMILMK